MLLAFSFSGAEVTMKIAETLSKEIEHARRDGRTLSVIIKMRNGEDVAALVARGVIKPNLVYQSIPELAADLTPAQIEEMEAMPQVEWIELSGEAHTLHPQ
jgi:hypothetical protein